MRAMLSASIKSFSGLLLAVVIYCSASFAATASDTGSFEFDGWDGPPLRIYYVEPEGLPADAPVVFVMHGVQRNADDYRDNWIALARRNGIAVYAPEFDDKRFKGAANYNLGSIGAERMSAFAAIEPLFDAVRARRSATLANYAIFGHSAGSQFVHRAVLFGKLPRAALAISANAGWYTMPTADEEWPYGLGGVEPSAYDLKIAFETPMIILLGAEDKDPRADNLRTTPEAMRQGKHRLERGAVFYQAAQRAAADLAAPLNWRAVVVPGAAHENDKMAVAAIPWIKFMFDEDAPNPLATETDKDATKTGAN